MPENQLVLSYIFGVLALLALGGLAIVAVFHAKNRIIRESQKALEAEQRLRRAQEAFTDNAHHELRTPVQILAGNLMMLSDLDPTPDQASILGQARRTTAQLGHLVQGLLDLSSLGHGTLTFQPGLTDLNAHLSGLRGRCDANAQTKGLRFHADLVPLPRPVICDPARLCQALEALLENALGFTTEGAVTFRMAARPEGRAWHLRFEIEDQGPGLPPDWERLLHPFEQEERGLRRRRGGLGIGLPLATGIIELLGGRMGFQPLALGTLAWVEIQLEEGEF
ncbi:sensor histidine kinase KdpD [Geothrix sp. 21YS21S-4]|uniref:sensor histidine kinase n=1 Tax=Geothrix sp. 21YS21S-4 TaxID=3068889 RepID=UPI0027B92BC4|nr:HAMP domain-containing sensor histidine kinase [Geothrix sp. 21YS21S-4]